VITRVAADLVVRIRQLTLDINALGAELETRTEAAAPRLRQIHGIGPLASAKLIGEVAGIERFRSRHAFARHNGTAPTPVWSGNTDRHRLSRAGNRQLNAAIHRAALTQARSHPDAIAFLKTARRPRGDSKRSHPLAEATPLRHHLPSHARRRRPHPKAAPPTRCLT
jgi:transposase